MKFLITGVNGFVGEELVSFLQENHNNSILGIDLNKNNEDSTNKRISFRQCLKAVTSCN